ncbi:hypothetical protein BV394_03440 [Brevirhabdus pacifica]|uniref:phosphoglycolate phosphatase n=1 Tax=Brevirhabdus pacifica TaxID=1267768 RepID=A0A1U7DG97_9RHOB|nr:HAD family hydrolase [Brevirhabdus pacifica]APX88898.1 hypothetical protein BV394_03440 [Brevirhabdus pacifica]PJJ86556.1 phosphoglycolate phosphatase [Brevirhabdus pacifica]
MRRQHKAAECVSEGRWPPVRGLLLDKDGTLFDFAASWNAWTAGIITELAEGDPERVARIAKVLEFDMAACCFYPESPVIAGTLAEIAQLLATVIREPDAATLETFLERRAARAEMVPAVDLTHFCAEMAGRGIALGLVTNDGEGAARAHLERAGVIGAFAFVAGYDSGHGAKPEAGPLLAGARALGLAPEEVVMVGDSLHDLAAGQAAGMRRLAVLTGPAPAQELAPHAEAVLRDIGEIAAWIDAQEGGETPR